MILNFQLTNVESKVYSTADDIRKYKNININYDVNLKNPSLVAQNTPFGEKSVLRVEYTFAINYLSPNIGHIRFEGCNGLLQRRGFKSPEGKMGLRKSAGGHPERAGKHNGCKSCASCVTALKVAWSSAIDAYSGN